MPARIRPRSTGLPRAAGSGATPPGDQPLPRRGQSPPEKQSFARQSRQQPTVLDSVLYQFDRATVRLPPIEDRIAYRRHVGRVVEGHPGQPNPQVHITFAWASSFGVHGLPPRATYRWESVNFRSSSGIVTGRMNFSASSATTPLPRQRRWQARDKADRARSPDLDHAPPGWLIARVGSVFVAYGSISRRSSEPALAGARLDVTGTALRLRYIAEHLLDVTSTSLVAGLAAPMADDSLTHVPFPFLCIRISRQSYLDCPAIASRQVRYPPSRLTACLPRWVSTRVALLPRCPT